MQTKVKLTKERFLDWYFSDNDDILITARNMIKELHSEGKYSVNVRELLDGCSELPDWIMKDYDEEKDWSDEGKYYTPEEIELV